MHFKQGGDIVGLPSPRPLPRSPHRGRDALHEGEGDRKSDCCTECSRIVAKNVGWWIVVVVVEENIQGGLWLWFWLLQRMFKVDL